MGTRQICALIGLVVDLLALIFTISGWVKFVSNDFTKIGYILFAVSGIVGAAGFIYDKIESNKTPKVRR